MDTLERTNTVRGELVLRRDGERYEIISNGVFLMDTSDGASERLLIDAALARCGAPRPRILIGGLGVGFSLLRALEHAEVSAVEVIEIEGTLLRWHREFLSHLTGDALADPRVRVRPADVSAWLATGTDRYDAICLDTDNGPNWLVFDGNAAVYDHTGLRNARARLHPGGVLAVWSAQPDDEFAARLATEFGRVEVLAMPRDRGAPDLVYVARVSADGETLLP